MGKSLVRKKLFQSVKVLIATAQQNVVRNVNTTMLLTYFEIGRMIVEDEQQGKQRAEYAKETLINLSSFLTNEFGKGYSVSNLEYMSSFYRTYQSRLISISQTASGILQNKRQKRISQTLSGQFESDSASKKTSPQNSFYFNLTWSHYVQLIKIKNDDERNFYEIESQVNNWTVRELQRQYNTSVYERIALSKNKNKVKQPKENKTIGIILCKEENKTVIEFTLPEKNKQIFAKEYKAILPTKAALAK